MIALNRRKCKGKWKYFSHNRKVISQIPLLYDTISLVYEKRKEIMGKRQEIPSEKRTFSIGYKNDPIVRSRTREIPAAQTEQWKEKN